MDTETGGGPAIGRSVWVIDDSAPERKVPGRIVSDATEGLFGEADSISISAHATSDAPTVSPQPGVGGTVNVASVTNKSHIDAKVDCFVSPAPTDPTPGTAQATAVVTRSTGIVSGIFPPGTEVRWDFFDSGMPQPAPNGDSAAFTRASLPCEFRGYTLPPFQTQLTQGNISVKNDDF